MVYPLIALPPVAAGAVNATVTSVALTFVTAPIVAVPGTVVAKMLDDATDAAPSPIVLVAVPVKV